MIYNSFQMVCSFALPKYSVEAVVPRAKFRHGGLSSCWVRETLFPKRLLYLSSWGLLRCLCQAQKDSHASAFLCSCLQPLSTDFCLSSAHLVSCAPRSLLQGWLVLTALQQQWQMSFSFSHCHTWNFAVHKVLAAWHLSAAGQYPPTGSLALPRWGSALPSGVWWQPASWKTREEY